jgi:hypothetical protein
MIAQLPNRERNNYNKDHGKMAMPVENVAWVVVAIGICTGGLVMIFGYRKADKKPLPGRIIGVVRQDWTPTGNIDLRASTLESSSPQPLRLWVEEKRITETAVGQHIVELRWRLATIEEGKALVICWSASQTAPSPLLPKTLLGDE